ncbi:Agenet-like domain [Dillenia turbinata]|uniref:Agenet-like domain n=1 Tax=Dillenia turbinata TaxID=194707 RepID=A0AAN8UU31_9MAGN
MGVMRFRKGYKVEVLSKEDSPSGSWRSAEIVSSNGKTYRVRYDSNSGSIGESIVVTVPRKVVRPFPPPTGSMKSWTVGDTVEVYNNGSWKAAMVSKVIGEVTFMVRLVDSSQEIQVNKLHMRVQQAWEDGTWTVIKKDLVKSEDVDTFQMCVNVTQTNAKVRSEARYGCLPAKGGVASQVPQTKKIPAGNARLSKKLKMEKGAKEGDGFIQDMFHPSSPHSVSSRTLKRRMPYSSSNIEMHAENKRMSVIVGGGTCQELAPEDLPFERIDSVAFPREDLGSEWKDVFQRSKVDDWICFLPLCVDTDYRRFTIRNAKYLGTVIMHQNLATSAHAMNLAGVLDENSLA